MEKGESSNPFKRWAARLLLIAAAFIIALLILEILAKIFWTRLTQIEQFSSISFVSTENHIKLPPPDYFWPGQIGNVKEFANRTSKNSLGFHDTEHSFEKPPGTFRIVVLGDSFVEAMQVPLEKTFHKILEADLKARFDFPIEVISLGRSGAGARQSTAFLSSYGIQYLPDLVIMEFLSNDLIDDNPLMKKAHNQQIALKKEYVPELRNIFPRYLLIKWSRFNQILALNLARIYQGILTAKYASKDEYGFIDLNLLIFAENYADLWKESWKKTQRFISRAGELCRENGSEMLVVAFAEQWRTLPPHAIKRVLRSTNRGTSNLHWDVGKTDRMMAEFCDGKNISFLSLLPGFKEARRQNRQRLFFAYDMHPNENGHKVAATVVADYLQKRNMIARKPTAR
jgi:lysophospholipase L1-like esterase